MVNTERIKIAVQDVYNISNNKVEYCEVLVREYEELVGVSAILRYIADKDMQVKFDLDIIEHSLRTLSKSEYYKDKIVAINICASTIYRIGCADKIVEIIKKYGNGMKIAIEVTENTKFHYVSVWENIKTLRENNIMVVLDDFGRQRANVDSLIYNEFDIIKIDKIFIERAHENKKAFNILYGISGICNRIGIPIIVEGVETQNQLDTARFIGADYVQGYILGTPKEIEERNSVIEYAS